MYTEVNEAIEVLVHFSQGQFKPFRFLWNKRVFNIQRITTSYKSKDGGVLKYFFAVESQHNLYEISYTTANQSWLITKTFSL